MSKQTSDHKMDISEEVKEFSHAPKPTVTKTTTATTTATTEAELDEFQNPLWEEATEVEDVNPKKAIKLYKQIIADEASGPKLKEESIFNVGRLYTKLGLQDDFRALFVNLRQFFTTIHKSRTAKIVRKLIDIVGEDSSQYDLQAEICLDAIEWCQKEKRTFLKQRIQTRLASVYLKLKKYNEAINLIQSLIREVKRFDDKLLLVEIYLTESRCHLALQNVPKSKGSLTAARSSANAIYCPPLLQAEIDLQAGILCSAEGDYKTAYSYFYEAFEGYSTMKESANAVRALKYMLVGKIMTNQYDDVYSLIHGKAGIKYSGIEIEAMKAVTDSYKLRSIHTFEAVFNKYKAQLADDPIVASHLVELKEKLLEQNLLRLIEPFSRVQIVHIAKLIQLPAEYVENKLSEMILDSKLSGILDQGTGDLIVFEQVVTDKTYDSALSTVKELSSVVDRLYTKAQKIHH